mgnify:CR=1 FL=1
MESGLDEYGPIHSELKVPKVVLEQPERGSGASVEETKMALPLSDAARLAVSHGRIERVLQAIALQEKLSMEAVYLWAADTLERLAAPQVEAAEPEPRGSLKWRNILLVLFTLTTGILIYIAAHRP